jgi:hypothetical protein
MIIAEDKRGERGGIESALSIEPRVNDQFYDQRKGALATLATIFSATIYSQKRA